MSFILGWLRRSSGHPCKGQRLISGWLSLEMMSVSRGPKEGLWAVGRSNNDCAPPYETVICVTAGSLERYWCTKLPGLWHSGGLLLIRLNHLQRWLPVVLLQSALD